MAERDDERVLPGTDDVLGRPGQAGGSMAEPLETDLLAGGADDEPPHQGRMAAADVEGGSGIASELRPPGGASGAGTAAGPVGSGVGDTSSDRGMAGTYATTQTVGDGSSGTPPLDPSDKTPRPEPGLAPGRSMPDSD